MPARGRAIGGSRLLRNDSEKGLVLDPKDGSMPGMRLELTFRVRRRGHEETYRQEHRGLRRHDQFVIGPRLFLRDAVERVRTRGGGLIGREGRGERQQDQRDERNGCQARNEMPPESDDLSTPVHERSHSKIRAHTGHRPSKRSPGNPRFTRGYEHRREQQYCRDEAGAGHKIVRSCLRSIRTPRPAAPRRLEAVRVQDFRKNPHSLGNSRARPIEVSVAVRKGDVAEPDGARL